MILFIKKIRLFASVFCLLLCCLSFCPAFAWNDEGHFLIAQIAYDNLHFKNRYRINKLIHKLYYYYPRSSTSFYRASAWADLIKSHDVMAFNDWHFISIPFSPDNTKLPSIPHENVVWAIIQSEQILHGSKSSDLQKALFLRFLIHFVGDIHQPLHCAIRVTKNQPNGDSGGVDFPIKNLYADKNVSWNQNNLHTLWDQGAGLFAKYFYHRTPNKFQVRRTARLIQKQYPKNYFKKELADSDPYHWAKESFLIAKNFAYHIKPNTKPSSAYIQKAQKIAEQRIALAGYRLAIMLNN